MNSDHDAEPSSRLLRIRRVSSILQILCLVGFAVMVLYAVNLVIFGLSFGLSTWSSETSRVTLSRATTLGFGSINIFQSHGVVSPLLLSWIEFAYTVIGIWLLYRLFGFYKSGLIFARVTIQGYRWIALWLLAGWIIPNLHQIITRFLLGRFARLSFSVDEFMVGGLLLMLISWIMDEGRKLQEEQALTV